VLVHLLYYLRAAQGMVEHGERRSVELQELSEQVAQHLRR
jgi:hypothetical protein